MQEFFEVVALLNARTCVLKWLHAPESAQDEHQHTICWIGKDNRGTECLTDGKGFVYPDVLWKPTAVDFVADVAMELVMHKEELKPNTDIEHLSTYALEAYGAIYKLAYSDKVEGFTEEPQ